MTIDRQPSLIYLFCWWSSSGVASNVSGRESTLWLGNIGSKTRDLLGCNEGCSEATPGPCSDALQDVAKIGFPGHFLTLLWFLCPLYGTMAQESTISERLHVECLLGNISREALYPLGLSAIFSLTHCQKKKDLSYCLPSSHDITSFASLLPLYLKSFYLDCWAWKRITELCWLLHKCSAP